ncbi:MAG: iron-containing alcohol dehydrogenase [Caldisericia bacterium]|nr:iron-containing alcohol dehydrogenase [Caldisericia bacterium]
MQNFQYYNPVQIIFGAGEVTKLPQISSKFGSRPLVMFGKSSAQKSGLADRVLKLLTDSGLDPVPFFGIEPNPRVTSCDAAAQLAREKSCDMVIAVGGGSVMDAAKITSAAIVTGQPTWDHVLRKASNDVALPIIMVPTIAATGSEFNWGAVISNWETHQKLSAYSLAFFPKVSIIDPELQVTTPPNTTAYGGIDIMIHVLETYLSSPDENSPIQDRITEGVCKTVIQYLPIAMQDGLDVNARAQLAWASAVALCGLPNAGRPGGFVIHWMEHVMSAHYDIPHGLGLAYLLVPMLSYFQHHFPKRFELYRENIIEDTENFLRSVGCLTNLGGLGIPESFAQKFADDLFDQKSVDGVLPGYPGLTKQAAMNILLGYRNY